MRARRLLEYLTTWLSLLVIGTVCLGWTVIALPLTFLLPAAVGRRVGRCGALVCSRSFVWILSVLRVYNFDIRALAALRCGPPVVLAPNHPSLIDAIIIIAHDPGIACVMKSTLGNNIFLGAGARLARYIRNDPPRRMINEAIAELARGGTVLLFPEGTRTVVAPVNALTGSVGLIAKYSAVPVQTLLIEQDTPCLGKGWPLLRPPAMPINYRIRMGRRFEPAEDAGALTTEIERYFHDALRCSSQNVWLDAARRARCRT